MLRQTVKNRLALEVRMRTEAAFTLAACLLAPVAGTAQTNVKTVPIVETDTTAAGASFAYPRTEAAEVTALLVEIEPGGETGRHLHPNPSFAYVLDGTLEVQTDDGTVHTPEPGGGFVEVQNTWHNGRNRGTSPVKVLVVFAGARGEPNVLRPK
jgi:quercetin dioxygenase-like cupin family protein